MRLIAIGLVTAMMSLTAATVRAAERPGEKALAKQLANKLPPYWAVSEIAVTASVNKGDAVEPIIEQRFEATVAPKSALYVNDSAAAEAFAPYVPIVPTLNQKDIRTLYGSARSTYSAGQWAMQIMLATSVSELGMPRRNFSGQTVVRGGGQKSETLESLKLGVARQAQRDEQAEINQQQARQEAQLRQLKADHANAVKTLKARYASEQQNFPKRLKDLEASLQREVQLAKQRHEAEMEDLKKHQQAAIRQASSDYQATLEKVKGEQDASLTGLRQQDESTTERLGLKHKREMEAIGREFDQKAAALRQDIQDIAKLIVLAKENQGNEAKPAEVAFATAVKQSGLASALLEAVKSGDVEAVKKSIANGADVDSRDAGDSTPLIWAAYGGNLQIVTVLVKSGADVDAAREKGGTALSYAARKGHLSIIKLLMDQGANVNLQIRDGWTALSAATSSGKQQAVEALLSKGADPNVAFKGWTPLMYAAHKGDEGIVRALVEHGADVEATLPDGKKAIDIAAQQAHDAIVNYLRYQ